MTTDSTSNPASSNISPIVINYSDAWSYSFSGPQSEQVLKTSDGVLHLFAQTGFSNFNCNGTYAGKLVWFKSTDNGQTWSCAGQISDHFTGITTTWDYPSAATDANDNIYIVYDTHRAGSGTAGDVYFRKLTKSGSDWLIGPERLLLDSTASTTGYDSAQILVEGNDRFWLAVRDVRNTSSDYRVTVYYSDGLSDNPTLTESLSPVDTIGTTDGAHTADLVRFANNKIAIIFFNNDEKLYMRTRTDGDVLTNWSSVSAVTTTTVYNNFTTGIYAATGTSGGNLFVVWVDATNEDYNFSYYNGSSWSTPVQIFPACTQCEHDINVISDGTDVWVVGLDATDHTSSTILPATLAYRKGVYPFASGDFSASEYPYGYNGKPDKVWSYMSGTYSDETADAQNSTTADVQLIKNTGDYLYIGSTEKFDTVSIDLNSAGTYPYGGIPTYWEYYNGSTWAPIEYFLSARYTTFVVNFDMNIEFIPAENWTTTQINNEGTSYYYVRASFGKSLTTAPVASKIHLSSNVDNLAALETVESSTPLIFWVEDSIVTSRIRVNLDYSVSSSPTPTPTSTPTASASPSSSSMSSSALGSSTSSAQPPVCTVTPPKKKPVINSVKGKGPHELEVIFTGPVDDFDSYSVSYSEFKGLLQHSVHGIPTSEWKLEIKHLKAATKYYIKMRTQKGCAPGEWTEEIEAETLAPPYTLPPIYPDVEPLYPDLTNLPQPIDVSEKSFSQTSLNPQATAESVSTEASPSTNRPIIFKLGALVNQIKGIFEKLYMRSLLIADDLLDTIAYQLDPQDTIISNLRVEDLGDTYALIVWETNHPATSKISYGNTPDYGFDVQSDYKVKSHQILVSGLQPETTYFYEVMSQGKTYAYDARHEFTTLGEGKIILPAVSPPKIEIENRKLSPTILVLVIFPEIILTLVSLINIVPLIPHIRWTPLNLFGILSGLIKKKRYPWGVVYDAETFTPLDPALVSLRQKSGEIVKQAITDYYGRYQFLVDSGEYILTVVCNNYVFPSKHKNTRENLFYPHPYFGEKITITKPDKINRNIPMDLVGELPFNEAEKIRRGITRVSKIEHFFIKVSYWIFVLGFLYSLLVTMINPITLNKLIIAIYILIILARKIVFTHRGWGVVRDRYHRPLAGAQVKLQNINQPDVYTSVYTDMYGRYSFLVGRGKFELLVSYPTDATSKQIVRTPPIEINENFGFIGQNIVLE